jgi:hypothetical protein
MGFEGEDGYAATSRGITRGMPTGIVCYSSSLPCSQCGASGTARWTEVTHHANGTDTVGKCMACRNGCAPDAPLEEVQAAYVRRVTDEMKASLRQEPATFVVSSFAPDTVTTPPKDREPVRGDDTSMPPPCPHCGRLVLSGVCCDRALAALRAKDCESVRGDDMPPEPVRRRGRKVKSSTQIEGKRIDFAIVDDPSVFADPLSALRKV